MVVSMTVDTIPSAPPPTGLPMPRSLSPSSMSTFTSCPLAFRFTYIEKLPEPPSAPASKGTLVHLALQHLMWRPAPERTFDAALADLARAREELAADAEFAQLELSDAEWEQFHADAEVLLRRYFEIEDPRDITVLGVELRVSAETADGVVIRGIIDRLELEVPAQELLGVGVELLPLGVGELELRELGVGRELGPGALEVGERGIERALGRRTPHEVLQREVHEGALAGRRRRRLGQLLDVREPERERAARERAHRARRQRSRHRQGRRGRCRWDRVDGHATTIQLG